MSGPFPFLISFHETKQKRLEVESPRNTVTIFLARLMRDDQEASQRMKYLILPSKKIARLRYGVEIVKIVRG